MRQHGWMRALVVLMAVVCLGGIAFAYEHKETRILSYNEMMELAEQGEINRVTLGAGEKLQPQLVIPLHWDNFFVPLNKPVVGMPRFVEKTERVFFELAKYCEAHDVPCAVQIPRTSIVL